MALEVFPFLHYYEKGNEKQKGHDWSLSKDKTGGKVGVGMSGIQPDTR